MNTDRGYIGLVTSVDYRIIMNEMDWIDDRNGSTASIPHMFNDSLITKTVLGNESLIQLI